MKNPTVSIIIPFRNEEKFIKVILQNILEQDFPLEKMEVLLLDGNSTDRTVDIILEYQHKHPQLKVILNPNQYVPHAINLGVKQANGKVIFIMGAHAAYPKDYVSKLLMWLEKLQADNVGGVLNTEPRSNTLKAKAIAISLSHPIGVGNSLFRIGVDNPQAVDTVPFGCYPKSVFEKYGLYDERLIRNQDIEFNKRLINQGGKIYLVPDVKCTYYARDTFSGLWKNNYGNGKWVILTAWLTKALDSLSLRHFIPLFFFANILLSIISIGLSITIGWNLWVGIFLLPLGIYFLLLSFFSLKISINKKKWQLLPLLICSFFTLHLSYGIGSFMGIFSSLTYPTNTSNS